MRGLRSLATSMLFATLSLDAAAQSGSTFGAYEPAPQFTEHVSTTLYLPMRDGVRLAMRITRPAQGGQPAAGRFPILWQHALTITEGPDSTERFKGAGLGQLPALTAYGYIVVQVARRGNGQSFGIRRGYNDRTEAGDAYEITEWLAAQSWSNGAVGVYGCSNTGDAAMHVLSSRPPHLRAVFAGCFSWSKFDAMRRGGIFAQWGTGPQRTVAEDVALEPVEGDSDRRLLRQAAEEHQKSTNLLELWKGLPYRDSWSPLVGTRFWAESSVSSYAQQLRQLSVPVYIMGGWHDELRDQGVIAWLNLPGSRLVLGPWKHCQNPGFELLQEIHRFFDSTLKDVNTGLAQEPRIHYYTMDGADHGTWHAADSWPVPGERAQRWYWLGQSKLSARAARRQMASAFTVHGSVDCPQGGVGPFMQPCHIAGEGLSLRSDPLDGDLSITGNPVVNVPVSADWPDVNVFAYLEDVAPDGNITVVTEGRLKASLAAEAIPPFKVPDTPWHRSYAEDAHPLQPGQSVALHFDLLPTSYVFPKAHHVELTITGADYRERGRDPNIEGARINVITTPENPVWVDLPVVEPRG
jgi:uncharacterized protein